MNDEFSSSIHGAGWSLILTKWGRPKVVFQDLTTREGWEAAVEEISALIDHDDALVIYHRDSLGFRFFIEPSQSDSASEFVKFIERHNAEEPAATDPHGGTSRRKAVFGYRFGRAGEGEEPEMRTYGFERSVAHDRYRASAADGSFGASREGSARPAAARARAKRGGSPLPASSAPARKRDWEPTPADPPAEPVSMPPVLPPPPVTPASSALAPAPPAAPSGPGHVPTTTDTSAPDRPPPSPPPFKRPDIALRFPLDSEEWLMLEPVKLTRSIIGAETDTSATHDGAGPAAGRIEKDCPSEGQTLGGPPSPSEPAP